MAPSLLQKIANKYSKSLIVEYWNSIYKDVPLTQLTELNTKNTRLLATRLDLLHLMPKNGVVAELGVDKGDFSTEILKLTLPKKLHLVDIWHTKRYDSKKKNYVQERFQQEANSGKLAINIGLSTEVADSFEDSYFDWIYIDTDHSYNTTIQELEKYRLKLKKGGIIAGHDFVRGSWKGLVRYGVIEAVYEFCVKYNWEIIFLTSEIDINPSFAIREIS